MSTRLEPGADLASAPIAASLAARAGTLDPEALEQRVATYSKLALALKRIFDVVFAAVALVVVLPLLVLLAVLVRLDSAGPALYWQRRIGLGQRFFRVVKLRTMDAEGRITRLGRFLRPTGLDEVPQLWNVLVGDMSVVGPRPEVADRVPGHLLHLPHFGSRHLMRPGITGWAQVNGLRGEASSIPRRLELDLEYVASWSLLLDAWILLCTAPTVLRDSYRALWN